MSVKTGFKKVEKEPKMISENNFEGMRIKVKTEPNHVIEFGGVEIPVRDEWVLIYSYDEEKESYVPKTYDMGAISEYILSEFQDF